MSPQPPGMPRIFPEQSWPGSNPAEHSPLPRLPLQQLFTCARPHTWSLVHRLPHEDTPPRPRIPSPLAEPSLYKLCWVQLVRSFLLLAWRVGQGFYRWQALPCSHHGTPHT